AAESGVARKPHPWCPLPNGVSTPQSRELAIRTLVERAATGFEPSIAPWDFDSGSTANSPERLQLSIIPHAAHCEVTLGTSDLLVCSTLESDLSLPLSILRVQLLFSDVMWTSVPFAGERVYAGASINDPLSPHYIVAVVPREDEHSCCVAAQGDRSTEPVSAAHGLPFQEAWLLCIGACSHSEFQDFLGELGCRGAIRWDLKKCYQLVRELNSGTFSSVYLGQSIQQIAGRSLISQAGNSAFVQNVTQVAVKGLKVQAQLTQSVVKSEIDFLVQCKGHPNITQLYGIFCSSLDSGTECSDASEQSDPASNSQLCWSLVMEFFPAGDLHDYLVLSGPLTEVDSMEIFCGVMSALAYLHFHRVAHRDVKAENILLSDTGQAVLADFGSAARIDDHLAMQTNCGSPGYAAPEVVDGRPYGVKADVFSSGVVLYFALCNEKPFHGPDVQTRLRQTSRCKVRFAVSKFGHVEGGVLTLLRALLEKKPQLRPLVVFRLFFFLKLFVLIIIVLEKSLDCFGLLQALVRSYQWHLLRGHLALLVCRGKAAKNTLIQQTNNIATNNTLITKQAFNSNVIFGVFGSLARCSVAHVPHWLHTRHSSQAAQSGFSYMIRTLVLPKVILIFLFVVICCCLLVFLCLFLHPKRLQGTLRSSSRCIAVNQRIPQTSEWRSQC
ncbi:unnamed protein product, partial [Polarella glacialis]